MAIRKPNTRIIGGDFKGTKIPFTPSKDIRPTENKTRETLFNWLMGDVKDSVCLDMFAGTGALGLEALSRGAKKVVFIEKNKDLCSGILGLIKKLSLEDCAVVINTDSLKYSFEEFNYQFDLIFLDPPFRKDMLDKAYGVCLDKNITHQSTLVYVESEMNLVKDFKKWKEIKTSKGGQTKFGLYTNET